MTEKNQSSEFKPLSEAELQLSANRWTAAKVAIFVAGVLCILLGAISHVYYRTIPHWLNLLLLFVGGHLVARARGMHF